MASIRPARERASLQRLCNSLGLYRAPATRSDPTTRPGDLGSGTRTTVWHQSTVRSSRPSQYAQLRLTNTNPTRPQWKCNSGHVSVREKKSIDSASAFNARNMCARGNGLYSLETQRRTAHASALYSSNWLGRMPAQEDRMRVQRTGR